MEKIYESKALNILKQNTVILGATIDLKKTIKDSLYKKCAVIDDSFSYSTKYFPFGS